ncbi:hypothetical protein A9Q94_06525 [Rhodobacterales bacterium 56_14_T64]|nr:hypothetical protein A9Q94_06525 [Rhodobacterales bacterium 56_14_T64]
MSSQPSTLSEAFTVEVETDEKCGHLISEVWKNRAGIVSRLGNLPAERTWDAKTGLILRETYKKAGLLHRDDDGPAEVYYAIVEDESRIECVEWYKNGIMTRSDDEPAAVSLDPVTGLTWHEEYRDKNGDLHRQGGKPALIFRDPQTKKFTQVEHYVHGEFQDQSKNLGPSFPEM